jgi:CMP-N-acetylneuraminic acid synthetase
MKILGLIPARGGSKSVPGKNIKKLNGKPLLQYTVEAAKQSKLLTRLILSSDDDKIIDVAKQVQLEVPFKRPSHLAQDNSATLPVLQHALDFFRSQNLYFDAICLLQVTSPFKTGEFIDVAIKKFINQGCDSLISVQRVPEKYNPHWTFKKDEYGNLQLSTNDAQIISRRQDLPTAYHRDGLIYIIKSKVVLEQNSLFGETIGFIESPYNETINIDTLSDWEKAESFLKFKNP